VADAAGDAPGAVATDADVEALAVFLKRLESEPHAFGFYLAMRRLEAAYPARPRLGRSARPSQDAVRLGQEPDVTFAPATLASYEPRADRPPRLAVQFFGLFGADGPLPLHLTEYARDRQRNGRDHTLQRFADMFHHRALSLFWRAWADSRPTISFDRPQEDRFSTYVGAVAGYGMDSLHRRDAMPDLTKLHFAGLFASQTRPAEGLAAILSAFFTMAVRVECFIGAWLTLDARDRTSLGTSRATGTIAQSAILGGRVWTRQEKFRLVFGPLSLPDYLRLLPGGLSFHRLVPIVRNYAGDTMLWDVNMVLRAEEVPQIRLGRQGRLGWTTWLLPRRSGTDAADLFLNASADSMAQRIDTNTRQDELEPTS
jgi:type VI secretion system protein ImpH